MNVRDRKLGQMPPWVAWLLMLFMFTCVFRIADAETVYVGVATNFRNTMQRLIQAFERTHPDRIVASYASTGKLYAQIRHGAPFQIFLAADARRPKQLIQDGLALAASRQTYALGRLVLWQPKATEPINSLSALGQFKRLAMANPKTAPYGVAAQQVLRALHGDHDLPERILGENIAQTFQFVGSGNVPVGFVALSQALSQAIPEADYWLVPQAYYAPIVQQSVVLTAASGQPAVRRFYAYLSAHETKRMIQEQGYGVVE